MSAQQKRAMDIWLDSATFDNDFKPMTLGMLAKVCDSEGIKTSSSALGRWKKKFGWDEQLSLKVTAATIDNGEANDLISKTSLAESTKKSQDDFQINNEAKALSYFLVVNDLQLLVERIKAGGKTTREDKKFYLEALKITAGREDALLDRIANSLLASNLLSPEEALQALRSTSVELEDDVDITDISIEE